MYLLAHIREAFLEADKIWTSSLLHRLCERPESPWKDIKGKPLSDRGLADKLRPYRIKSRDVKIDGEVRKGFYRSDFHDAWKRFVDPVPLKATSATSATKLINGTKKVAEVADRPTLPDLPDFLRRAS